MNINLNDENIVKIVYKTYNDCVITLNFHDGELASTETYDKGIKQKAVPTDSEMIARIKTSSFMDELNKAKTRLKLAKENGNTIEKECPHMEEAKPKNAYSDESLNAVKEIIKMDEDGRLDEIVKNQHKRIGKNLYLNNECEDEYDSYECQKNLDKIGEKILMRLENSDDVKNDEKFNKLIDDYKFYKDKKKELDDKVWNGKYNGENKY